MIRIGHQPVFRAAGHDDDEDPEVTQIESLCMNCHANGITRLLLTRIPYYKNVVVMSFSCEECGYQNNELQPGGTYAEKGVLWKLRVETPTDLNRQVVKTDYTSVRIPELDFEIPAKTQSGEVTTVEGIVTRAVAGLTQDQAARREQHPEAAQQIDDFIQRLKKLIQLDEHAPWTLELQDISGNCFVENPEAPRRDPRCTRTEFERTTEQRHQLGIYTPDEHRDEEDEQSSRDESTADSEQQQQQQRQQQQEQQQHLLSPAAASSLQYEQLAADDVMQFRTNCPDCDSPCTTNMKMTNIPHFKEVVIMSTTCDYCGHRTNEVKSGGGIEPKGVRFEVRVANRDDFSRDILKSETCSMEIPELQLEVGGRALGGRFTTAEGILTATLQQLSDCPGAIGDAPGINTDGLKSFVAKVEEVLRCERAVTLVLDDPAGNSYVQSLAEDPTACDDGLKITRYERTFEQNDELGINDMNTDHYKTDN